MNIALRPSLFWDTDVSTMDLEKHKKAIIVRTLMRGTKEEFVEVLGFYGRDTVRETVLNTRYLDKYSLAFCCTLFELQKTDFRCYKLEQSMPSH